MGALGVGGTYACCSHKSGKWPTVLTMIVKLDPLHVSVAKVKSTHTHGYAKKLAIKR